MLANLLLLLTFVLNHRCFEAFVPVRAGTRSLEALLVGAGMVGLVYFTYVEGNLAARSLILSLTCLVLALLSSVTLLALPRCRSAYALFCHRRTLCGVCADGCDALYWGALS